MYVRVNQDNSLIMDADFHALAPNTSFPTSIEVIDLEEFNIFPCLSQKSFNPIAERLTMCEPYKENGAYYCVEVTALTLAEVKSNQCDVVSANLVDYRNVGFLYKSNKFDIDDTAQTNMTTVQVKFLLGAVNAHGGYWRSYDNVNVPMTDAEVQAYFSAAYVYSLTAIQTSFVRKDFINSRSTVQQVLAALTSVG